MKRFFNVFLIAIIASSMIFSSCKKDDDDDDDGTPTPSASMTCKINGTPWSAIIKLTNKIDNTFSIKGTSILGEIVLVTINHLEEGTYNYDVTNLTDANVAYTSVNLTAYAPISGTITITKVDEVNKKISGTFNGNNVNLSDTKNITEGKFENLSYIDS